MSSPRRALIVIDAQSEYFDGALPIQYPPRDESVARIAQAVDAATAARIPVVVVRHEYPAGTPVFGAGSATAQNHPLVAERAPGAAKALTKSHASIFAGTDLDDWLRAEKIDTLSLVGYMTNNCVVGSAAAAEPLGYSVEVLSDATGAIDLANDAGHATAEQVHRTLMALLHSNWAAVADTETWAAAVAAGQALPADDLLSSAARGRTEHSAR